MLISSKAPNSSIASVCTKLQITGTQSWGLVSTKAKGWSLKKKKHTKTKQTKKVVCIYSHFYGIVKKEWDAFGKETF